MSAGGLDAITRRKHPTQWEKFIESPLMFLAEKLYHASISNLPPAPIDAPFRLVCISDTHNGQDAVPTLPVGDVLIHAGDLTHSGTPKELRAALAWLQKQPHLYKIFIAGNHDSGLADPTFQEEIREMYPDLIYLQESAVTITSLEGRTFKVYGSPYTPKFGSWLFQYPIIKPLEVPYSTRWSDIPPDTDILITHGPAAYHLDLKNGCPALLDTLWTVRPRVHVFGHIHAGRGVETVPWNDPQLRYEKILSGLGGWWDLLVLFRWVLTCWFWPCRKQDSVGESKSSTIMVNAASIEKSKTSERRPAIVIEI
ncbi:Metallo-dependent phosphatase-like protein [Abortiporus biennis]|nr:Metallo-dependent phosphatase-like protein [Abortiporus biennis]